MGPGLSRDAQGVTVNRYPNSIPRASPQVSVVPARKENPIDDRVCFSICKPDLTIGNKYCKSPLALLAPSQRTRVLKERRNRVRACRISFLKTLSCESGDTKSGCRSSTRNIRLNPQSPSQSLAEPLLLPRLSRCHRPIVNAILHRGIRGKTALPSKLRATRREGIGRDRGRSYQTPFFHLFTVRTDLIWGNNGSNPVPDFSGHTGQLIIQSW
jgi:hypothetical protein